MTLRSAVETVHRWAPCLLWPRSCFTPSIPRAYPNSWDQWSSGSHAFHSHVPPPDSAAVGGERAGLATSLWRTGPRGFPKRASSSLGVISPAPLKLNDIVVLQSVEKLPPEDIATMWKTFYSTKAAEMSWTLHRDQWQTIQHRMRQHKMVVLPVHKDPVAVQGSQRCFLSMLCQAQMPKNMLITPLTSFHQHASDARPSIVVTIYEELMESKSIVLGRADILDGSVMSKPEAMKMVDDLLLCYMDDALYHHIVLLNQSSNDFNFDVFVDSLFKHSTQ